MPCTRMEITLAGAASPATRLPHASLRAHLQRRISNLSGQRHSTELKTHIRIVSVSLVFA